MKNVFLYISNETMLSKLETELTSNGVTVVTISEQSLDGDEQQKVQEISNLIKQHKVTHVESGLRYLEMAVFKIAESAGIKALSSVYETAFFSNGQLPKHMGVGQVVGLNNEPEIDEGDVIATNFTQSYLPHFA